MGHVICVFNSFQFSPLFLNRPTFADIRLHITEGCAGSAPATLILNLGLQALGNGARVLRA